MFYSTTVCMSFAGMLLGCYIGPSDQGAGSEVLGVRHKACTCLC